jgi:TolB protein
MLRLSWLAVGLLLAVLVPGVRAEDTLPGRLLFVKDGDLWSYENGTPRAMATGGTWSQPSWSPDGNGLAYVYRGANFADIFVTDIQGENQTRLTNSQSTVLDDNDWNFRPAWSPDGTLIAFVSDKDSTFPVPWLMNARDGSGRRALSMAGLQAEAVDSLAWSPDSTQLAVTIFAEPGPTQIALIPVGRNSRQPGQVLTANPNGAFDPAWSPDGTWIAYAARDGFADELSAMRADGSASQQLTQEGFRIRGPAWSPDGRHLAYLSSRTGWFEVWVRDVSTDASGALVVSDARQLTRELHVDAISGLSWGR